MRKLYVILAWVVAIGVVVQAAAIALGVSGMVHYVRGGGVVDSGLLAPGDRPFAFSGEIGFLIHALVGGLVIPIAAFLLMLGSFFVKRPRARLWGVVVFGVAFLQVMAGYSLTDVPYLGLFHGANALILLVTALLAARTATGRSSTKALSEALAEAGNVRS